MCTNLIAYIKYKRVYINILDMISAKNFHSLDKRLVSTSLSSGSERGVEYDKRPVYYISDKNLRTQFDDNIGGSDNRRESQTCKAVPDRRVIDRSTFRRLRSKAVVVTAEDRRKIAEDLMADRERLENESAARKQKLQSYDALRTKGKQLAQVGGIFKGFCTSDSADRSFGQSVIHGLKYAIRLQSVLSRLWIQSAVKP